MVLHFIASVVSSVSGNIVNLFKFETKRILVVINMTQTILLSNYSCSACCKHCNVSSKLHQTHRGAPFCYLHVYKIN